VENGVIIAAIILIFGYKHLQECPGGNNPPTVFYLSVLFPEMGTPFWSL
jgi:hypothetical protein